MDVVILIRHLYCSNGDLSLPNGESISKASFLSRPSIQRFQIQQKFRAGTTPTQSPILESQTLRQSFSVLQPVCSWMESQHSCTSTFWLQSAYCVEWYTKQDVFGEEFYNL